MAFTPSYDVASRVHLIKSPSLAVPPPVQFPTDVHPLPPDLQAYFVYPFSLESYVLAPNNPNAKTIEDLHNRHQQFLQWREDEKHRREKERLRRVAPGWSGETAVLQPTKRASVTTQGEAASSDDNLALDSISSTKSSASAPLDAMAELVEHLNKLDSAASARTSASLPEQKAS